ncbi:helix-turn-helix domain-containing protein [Hungatella hathewayi]|uniref:Helix-turn-helix domain-containing protein n=1 Tax=Hungatella hathewayi TaxID=154046 RepID=A0AAW9WQH3_9FIRM|nr:helix-turn-helix domain-containing protein [Hungatella hathewayi]
MSFSDNLQVLRKRNNMTQEQLAEQLEVSRQAVSKWESGVSQTKGY